MASTSPLIGRLDLTPTGSSGEQFQSEISAAVAVGGGLFLFSSGGGSSLQVSDASDPANPQLLQRLALGDYTSTSVAAHGDLLALALVPVGYDSAPSPGLVRFFRVGVGGVLTPLADVQVGFLPDSLAFSADGRRLVVANEGQPSADYGIDPEGSISVIAIAGTAAAPRFDATTIAFGGLRLPEGVRLSGPAGTTAAQDLEPEYVSVLGGKAYVSLQENNAVAVVNLESRRIERILPLGSVDDRSLAVDLSDKDGAGGARALLPKLGQDFRGLRMPDGVSAFRTRGRTYLITANEGDAREYGSYTDVGRNPAAPNGRLNTLLDPAPSGAPSNVSLGGRSLTIFDARTGALVWDSGTSLQTIAIAAGTYDDGRSDDKGVEPENVVVAQLDGRSYAIAGLERGSKTTLVVFDVTRPERTTYVSHVVIDGSISPEGLAVVPAAQSPSGQPLLVVSNEISNTLDLLDLRTLVSTPGPGDAGTFATPMVRDVAGVGPELQVSNLITNGEFIQGLEPGAPVYSPTGIFDGLGAYDNGDGTYTVLANSELGSTVGVPYLVDGVALTGARISRFIVDKDVDDDRSNGFQSALIAGGIAYEQIIDANGELVSAASQINGGLNRFCSSSFEAAHRFGKGRGFRDSLLLVGEEADEGLFYALDAKGRTLHAMPGLGRGGWETAIQVDTGSRHTVGVLLLDDNTAPLYLWVGEKAKGRGKGFLERNGLAAGQGNLYTWVPVQGSIGTADGSAGVPDSADLNALGLGVEAAGRWVLVGSGREVAGWDEPTLRTNANALGALQLSRLEDASINPLNGREVVFATTGNSAFGAADTFGNLIRLDLAAAFNARGLIAADGGGTDLSVIYDGDRLKGAWEAANGPIDSDAERGAFGATIVRNPDNLTWSADGFLYVQEDRSVPASWFSQQEASIWKLDPTATDPLTGQLLAERWLQVDRSAVPGGYGQSDPNPADFGNWETSGIIDVSAIYGVAPGAIFLSDVQAHNLTNGSIGGSGYLVQGGQLHLIQDTSLF